ncbi:MAG TPA: carboxypeptidase regulatory-like domain-containing protein, partial [Candidatus Rubrimentiphilum sp.]|nr:carboxypeptidase regulatory-like domain-containing protein [Candidatus Rubrimentiphilum sp.]
MHHLKRRTRIMAGFLAMAFVCAGLVAPTPAFAGTTGNITGTITDATSGAPLANVKVTAVSLSQTATSTSDAKGFYSIVDIVPDTYTVTFALTGYEPATAAGVTVVQDQTVTVNQQLHTALRTIASVHASAQSNLVKPNQGSDVYTVGGAQLQAATNPGGLHETLYQYLAVTPGVTGTGFPAQPRVRGGQVTDLGYEFEGIPIQDRITGFFTTNLSNIGISNIEVYTGGLPASGATNGTGYFNSILKSGTYPGFGNAFFQATSPEFNNYVTLERGQATANHKFSYYVAFDGVNSQNQYDYGENTYPNLVLYSFDGSGPVKTRDWVSNFSYRPDPADTIQAVLTNSNGDFIFNYLLNKPTGQPPALSLIPCPGNVPSNTSFSGWGGGTAPNGQSCPEGFFFGSLPNGGGNIWHHYGGLGKIQWNHNLNDHSFFSFRLSENFNQYIFDQPMADPNIPSLENNPQWNWAVANGAPQSACPAYPYVAGTPVLPMAGVPGVPCVQDYGVQVFWGDRNSHMYFANLDYTNALSAKSTLKLGGSYERDYNVFNYFCENVFNANGTWPDNYLRSIYPTDIMTAYAEDDVHVGKFLFEPGLEWAAERYAFPINGGVT